MRQQTISTHGDAHAKTRSRKKRVVFACLIFLGLYLIVEMLSLAAFGLVTGHPFSFTAVQAERETRLAPQTAADGTSSTGDGTGTGSPGPAFVASKSLHPYVGYVITPNLDSPTLAGEDHSPTPHFGYYDGNPIHKRSDDTVIIGIVGGSVALGFGISGIERLQERLKAAESFAGKKIIFARLAVSGYKQPQQYLTISYLLALGAEFDMVINLDGFNEVALHPAENGKTNTFAAYPRMWYFQTAESRQRNALRYHSLCYSRQELAKTFRRAGLRHSAFCNLVWKLCDRGLETDIFTAQQAMLNETGQQAAYEATGPARRYADESAMMHDLVSIWKQSSLQLDRLCRANQIAYFQFLQPNQYVPGSKTLSERERQEAFDENQPYRRGAELGYPLLRQAGNELKQQEVRFTDLTQVFSERDETIYIDSCCHYNDLGYEIIADRIAQEILSQFTKNERPR